MAGQYVEPRKSPEETFGLRAYVNDAADNRVTLAHLASTWQMARIGVVCTRAADLARVPNTIARIRGAWGRKLAEGASVEAVAKQPCPWPAPCAYDLFFNSFGRVDGRIELPKPFVLSAEAAGGNLVVNLTLFGIASDWAGEAADALVRGLRHGLDEAGNNRRPLDVIDRNIGVSSGLPVADMANGASLVFTSPVVVRSGEQLHVRPASLIKSLGNRLEGLARWHGMSIDLDPARFSQEAELLGHHAVWHIDDQPVWRRGSLAQKRRMDMAGVLGTLALPPLSPFMATLLSLGAYAHVGSRAALGMGHYRLALSPF